MATPDALNPYEVLAGHELDAYVHQHVLKKPLNHQIPKYSTDAGEADQLRREIERQGRVKIVVGQTSSRRKLWFARYELQTGNPTEVLAEDYSLAICRLAILLARRL
jgi:hypothetical protein